MNYDFLPIKLHQAIEAEGIPIHGVCPRNPNDNKTWSICFKDEATPEQKAQAQTIIDSFVYEDSAPVSEFDVLKAKVDALEAK